MTLQGRGLHSGRPCRVTLERTNGPVAFFIDQEAVPIRSLRVERAKRGVLVRHEKSGCRVDLVEHLLAALGGLSVHEGIGIRVEGGEIPLLDGGALAHAHAVLSLDACPSPPPTRVAQTKTLRIDGSRYVFSPADRVEIHVEVSFVAVGTQVAHWDGTRPAFMSYIAPARTFGFRSEAAELIERGLARGVDPRAVMILNQAGEVEPPGAPAGPGELARHKLLDLIGDLYLFGGPPLGRLQATRPGHESNHRAMRTALECGLVVGNSATERRAPLETRQKERYAKGQ